MIPVLLIVLVAGFFAIRKTASPEPGLVRVEGYVHYEPNEPVCEAQTPECGVCIGKVVAGECWIDPAQLIEL